MKEQKIKKSLRFELEIYEKIEQILKTSKYNFTTLINMAVFNFLQNIDLKSEKIDLDKKADNKAKEIRFKLSNYEFEFFKNLAIIHGFNSASKEIKFLILNQFGNKKLFNNIEMQELNKNMTDLNKLGRNINEIARFVREKKAYEFTFNFKDFGGMLNEINLQIKSINDLICDYREKLDLKINNA